MILGSTVDAEGTVTFNAATPIAGINIAELDNVTTDVEPADNELLSFDSASETWINQTQAEAAIDTDLVNDTTPQLGGNLDLNSRDITGTGNIGTTGTLAVTGTGDIEGNAILGGTVDVEGVATFASTPVLQANLDVEGTTLLVGTVDTEGVVTHNAATHVIVGNATVEGSLLAMAEATDEHVLTFNTSTETWEPQAAAVTVPDIEALADIADVTTETMAVAQDGHHLAWSDSAEVWEDQSPYLVGGWTYLAQTATSADTETSIDIMSEVDMGGVDVIEILFFGVSTETISQCPIVRVGPATGVVSTGYTNTAGLIAAASAATTAFTDGFYSYDNPNYAVADAMTGVMRLTRWDPAEHIWLMSTNLDTNGLTHTSAGQVALAGELADIALTTPGGAATFDAGEIRVRYKTSSPALVAGGFVSGTNVDVSSGSPTTAAFTNIPTGVEFLIISFDGVSSTGTDEYIVQLGDSGGLETSGYECNSVNPDGSSNLSITTGFSLQSNSAAALHDGHMFLTRRTGNSWVSTHTLGGQNTSDGGGQKTLTGELDRLTVLHDGSDTFDAGDINIMYAVSAAAATSLSGLSDVTTETMGSAQDNLVLAWNDSAEVWEDTPKHTNGTSVNMATGTPTSVDFTGIPAGTTRVVLSFTGLSTNGTSHLWIQLGDSGGFETSGYAGTSQSSVALSSAFSIPSNSAANIWEGAYIFTLVDSATNLWSCTGTHGLSQTAFSDNIAGSKALTDALTQIRVTTLNGTDTYDAGTCNIQYS